MAEADEIKICRYCGYSGSGNYCSECGQPFKLKRITLSSLLHDIFHLFTHLDKGIGYTIKQLIVAPGHMQRRYIRGDRKNYQKPFSLFFICGTITALVRYWILKSVVNEYDVADNSEVSFFNDYMLLLHISMLPLYILITYLFFIKSGYNYAEIGVVTLYAVSFFFLGSAIISFLNIPFKHLDTAYIELPLILIYNAVTFRNFFNKQNQWVVMFKSTMIVVILFTILQFVEDYIIESL